MNQQISSRSILDGGFISRSHFYMWNDFKFPLNGSLLSKSILNYFVNTYYDKIISDDIVNLNSYAVILKIEFTDNTVRSISKVSVFNKHSSKDHLIDLFWSYWLLQNDYYLLKEIKHLVISYRLFHKNKVVPGSRSNFKIVGPKSTEFRYEGISLPNTTDLNNWGKVISQEQPNSIYIESHIRLNSSSLFYNIFKYKDHHLIQVFNKNTLLSSVKDIFINDNKNPKSFIRQINNNKFTYKNGVLIRKEIERKLQYIQPISKTLYRKSDFLTLDIETKNVNGVLQPICISIYDGSIVKSFFINDYISELDMIYNAFNFFKTRKYNYQKVYVHNLSYFDGVFLLKNLSLIGKIKPLMRNGQVYNIRVELPGKGLQKHVFYLRDSLLILPASLDKLSQSFQVKNKKTIFPIFCVNTYPLNYIGHIPDKDYFKNIIDYNQYLLQHKDIEKGHWNLKNELIKYCENDAISLHQVLNTFSLEIFKLYRLDISKYMTLSSIAFAIFRSNFMKYSNICKITGEMYKDILKSYKGGLVDMYKPDGVNLYLQDVNSEYPDSMCLDMPGGKVKYFEGNLDLLDHANFGFFKAKIVANDKLNMPVLPVKYKNSIICPTGEWTDWYFSEELKEAVLNYGYKVTVLKGYIFERINPFNEFVHSLYSVKENTSKKDVKYIIVKFILNMLYGRFGMSPDKEDTLILNQMEAEDFYLRSDIYITNVVDLGQGREMLTVTPIKDKVDEDDAFGPNISIAVASAVVSYGRIKINKLKHLNGIEVYYSDTDSIVTDKPLPPSYLGSKLGQLKIENKIKIGYFIAPKVYGFIDEDNNNIVKVKGLKTKLFFYELSILLYKNNYIEKPQDKWYRDWSNGFISIRQENYRLIATGNKRQLIFDSFSRLVDTKPFHFVDNSILNNHFGHRLNISPPNFKDKLLL